MLQSRRRFLLTTSGAAAAGVASGLRLAMAEPPKRLARQIVDRGFVPFYEYAFQTLNDIRYDRWRDFDPEDSLRFYALRMRESGMIRSSPQEIIARGTDWRFLKEVKRELKA